MNITFSKMHGAGNDFIMLTGTELVSSTTLKKEKVAELCNRKRGIGANGLIIVSIPEQKTGYDARMIYYNSNGSRGEMCGNGLRCAAWYARHRLNQPKELSIKTDAGLLYTEIINKSSVKIEIPYIAEFKKTSINDREMYFGNTGVPHVVVFVDDAKKINVNREGRFLRYHEKFSPAGTNVNFVSINKKSKDKSSFLIRTYERGVEEETSACGTGISASAICAYLYKNATSPVKFTTIDDDQLQVKVPEDKPLTKVYLTGPVYEVFTGIISGNFGSSQK